MYRCICTYINAYTNIEEPFNLQGGRLPATGLCHRVAALPRDIGVLFPRNQRQHRTSPIQKDVLPYVSC